jgi:Tol biopolymer transport system component
VKHPGLVVVALVVGTAALGLRSCAKQHSRPPGHGDISFDISPQGDRLVFNAVGQGGRDLFLLNLKTLRVTPVAETPDYEVDPAFSPDGKSIVFAAGKPGERADHLFVRSLDGKTVRQLTDDDANDSAPKFSPDGSQVVFMRDKTYLWGGKAANWGGDEVACIVNADGTSFRQITADGLTAGYPSFSLDGRSVQFWGDGAVYEVAIGKPRRPRRLRKQVPVYAAYSPDGKQMAYSKGVYSPDHEIFVSDLDGSRARQVTDSDEGSFEPLFTPDGKKLLFLRESWSQGLSGEPKMSLWQVGVDGEPERRLADSGLFDDPLRWNAKAK